MSKRTKKHEEENHQTMTDPKEQDVTATDIEMENNIEAEEVAAEQPTASSEVEIEVERLTALAEENNQRYLRTQADFDNFRRRTTKEREELAKYASLKLVEQLVPILDNFDRALQVSHDNQEVVAFAKGVDMIYRQFSQVLEQEGVQAMNSVGQPFNPEFHQAIMQVESDDFEEGIVVEEVQKGYMLKDKVLRPAMVKVSM